MRHLASLLASLTTVAALTGGAAVAKPARPVDSGLVIQQAPPPISIVGRGSRIDGHVLARGDELLRCSRGSRATFLRARVSLRWNADGAITRASVTGGSAAFNRCAGRALLGQLDGFDPLTGRKGAARTSFAIRKPAQIVDRTPAPPPADTLQFCQADDDCTVYFRTSSCVPSDPVAVNGHDLKAVVAKYGHKNDPCGMGGPQYEKLRWQNEGRWTASCVQQTCTLQEHVKNDKFGPL